MMISILDTYVSFLVTLLNGTGVEVKSQLIIFRVLTYERTMDLTIFIDGGWHDHEEIVTLAFVRESEFVWKQDIGCVFILGLFTAKIMQLECIF